MKIGFFGCGNMGRAIAEGIRKNDSQAELFFYTPSQTKANELATRLKGIHISKCEEMPVDLDWAILAMKPQSLGDFHYKFHPSAQILSVLAGVGIEKLQSKFNVQAIARLMPNTPSAVGMGANLLFTETKADELKSLLSSLGKVYEMQSEEQLDQLTAFSGSGPALIFEFARQFEEGIKAFGGHPDAREIITQTFLGSAMLMESSDASFETLREQVTSKKGVTFEALQVLEKNNLTSIMKEAFQAAYRRTLEIKKGE